MQIKLVLYLLAIVSGFTGGQAARAAEQIGGGVEYSASVIAGESTQKGGLAEAAIVAELSLQTPCNAVIFPLVTAPTGSMPLTPVERRDLTLQ